MHTPSAIVVGAGALALAAALPTHAAIIYQARAATPSAAHIIADPDEPNSFDEITIEPPAREYDRRVGDTITFAGTDRFVTRFDARIIAFSGVAAGLALDVELTIYTNVGGLPGTALWSGIAPGVTLPNSTISSIDASFTPNITVPDSICFGIAFTAITRSPNESRIFGASSTNFVSIGSSPNTILRQRSADGVWFAEDLGTGGGGIFRNVEARVEAVPAPSTAAIPLALFAHRTRRRRR